MPCLRLTGHRLLQSSTDLQSMNLFQQGAGGFSGHDWQQHDFDPRCLKHVAFILVDGFQSVIAPFDVNVRLDAFQKSSGVQFLKNMDGIDRLQRGEDGRAIVGAVCWPSRLLSTRSCHRHRWLRRRATRVALLAGVFEMVTWPRCRMSKQPLVTTSFFPASPQAVAPAAPDRSQR